MTASIPEQRYLGPQGRSTRPTVVSARSPKKLGQIGVGGPI